MTCAIIAHEQKALTKIFEIVKRAYENLPLALKPITKADNVNEFVFTHRYDGVKLDSSVYVALKIRSGTVQKLHITESAYIKDRQELNSGSKQAVPKTGFITEETTANGFDQFYDLYMESHQNQRIGEMDYKTYFYAWFENPDYTLSGAIDEYEKAELELKEKFNLTDGQLLWRRWKIKELRKDSMGIGLTGEQLFKQEYPSTILEAFQSGSGNVFNAEKLESLHPKEPMRWNDIESYIMQQQLPEEYKTKAKSLYDKGVWFWHLPEAGEDYVCGVDPSDGQGSDYGPIVIWTKKPNDTQNHKIQQCAQLYGKFLPDDLAEFIKELCEFYNRAYAGVENNMLSTILFLSKIYDNFYYETRIDEKTQKRTKKIGWNTNVQTREKMIDDFIIHFEEDLLEINSIVTLKEMKTFVRKLRPSGGYKREHADGKFDDALFSDFIAVQMSLHRRLEARAFSFKPAGY